MAEGRSITTGVREELDHFFRRESGKVVAALVRLFGATQLDLIEDIVQDVLIKGLTDWPAEGIPVKPLSWMIAVAHNRMVDALRHQAFVMQNEERIAEHLRLLAHASDDLDESDELVRDATLRMIFACAHEVLPRESQIILVLRLMFGFSLPQIADALGVQQAAAAKRLVRAKQKLTPEFFVIDLQDPLAIQSRLPAVLNALYLIFAIGHNSESRAARTGRNVCEDALYLLRSLSDAPQIDDPRVDALLALMLFQTARSERDEGLLHEAEQTMERAARGDSISTYHLEAAIAGQLAHSDCNWQEVVDLYEILALMTDSDSVRAALAAARLKL